MANHSYKNTRLDKSDREKQVCVYCQSKNHISTRCVNVKNVETRKNILRSSGRCYLCLNKGHRIQHCKVKYASTKCSSKRHNFSICEKIKQDEEIKNEDNNEAPPIENVIMQVDSNLQSIFCYKLQIWKFLIVVKIGRLPVEFCLIRAASVPTAPIIYEKL